MYIASQIIETVAIIITLASYHFKTKKNIFKGMCLANIFEITHYLFLKSLLIAWATTVADCDCCFGSLKPTLEPIA